MKPSTSIKIASALGALGVILGAFGAHALKARFAISGTGELWQRAVFYQLVHAGPFLAVAIWSISSNPSRRRQLNRVTMSWLVGILLFSGSLYALALGVSARYIWPLTPLGGAALIVGWSLLAYAGCSAARDETT